MTDYFVVNFNPFALQFTENFGIRWYSLSYLAGLFVAIFFGKKRYSYLNFESQDKAVDFIFSCFFGAIIGGRVGYVFLYGFDQFLNNPLYLFKVWEGGMSFHGGLLGVIVTLLIFAKKQLVSFWKVADYVAPLVPAGLFFGRIANFINGELPGRVTEVSWAMIFPLIDSNPRHPSQLYEAFLEGFVLFIILNILWKVKPREGIIACSFLILYGLFRFLIEFFRTPDAHIGLYFNWLTQGQIFCLAMIIAGFLVFLITKRNKNAI